MIDRHHQRRALATPLRKRSRNHRPLHRDERRATRSRRRRAAGGSSFALAKSTTGSRCVCRRRLVNTRNSHFLNVVARLKPGVAVEAADREMKSIAAQLTQEYPDSNRDVGAVVVSVREDVLGDTRVEVLVLMIAAASIVLIACANLASLLLSRAWARRGEYAVRLSLGATRSRLVRQIVTEALCLSVIGGVLGLAIPLLTGRCSNGSCLSDCSRPRRSSTGGSLPSQEGCRSRPACSSASDPHSSPPALDCGSAPAACAGCRWHGNDRTVP